MLPKTKIGWRAVALGAGFWGLFGLWQWLAKFDWGVGEGFFDIPQLAIPLLLAGICGSASMILGVMALWKKDISVVGVLTTIWGILVTLFAIGEIIGSH